MKGSCSRCGHTASIEAFLDDALARQCLGLALRSPKSLADRLMRYLGLFKPAKQVLRWPRALKLMEQLVTDMDRGAINRHGRDWVAPEAAWVAALDIVLDQVGTGKLTLPLKDHAYLYSIIANGRNDAEAKQENQREAQRQQRKVGDQIPNPFQPQSKADDERTEQARRNRLALAKSCVLNDIAARKNLKMLPLNRESAIELLKDNGYADCEAILKTINWSV